MMFSRWAKLKKDFYKQKKDHFVITTVGEPIEIEATVTMVAHQGEQISQPVGCAEKAENPDYTNVRLQVIVE